jgi:gluconokinase
MSAGIPLTDADRLPWLQTIRATAEKACAEQWASGDKTGLGRPSLVIACSSLRKYYRDILRGDVEVQNTQPVSISAGRSRGAGREMKPGQSSADIPQPKLRTIFVYCKGTPELLEQRIAARKNHFMKPEMLASQLATLESPESEPGVAVVDISTSPEEVSAAALAGTRAIVAELEARGE